MGAREDLKACRANNAALRAERDKLTAQVAARDATIAQKEAQIADLQHQVEAGGATIADLNRVIVEKNNLLAERDATIADLNNRIDANEAQIASLQQQLDDCTGTGTDYPNVVKPGESIQGAINDLGNEDIITLDGAFQSQSAVNCSHPGMTLQGGPNGASIKFVGVQDGVRLKKGPGEWWESVTVKKLELLGAERSGLVLGRDCKILNVDSHNHGEIGISGNGDGVAHLNAYIYQAKLHNNGSVANLGHGSSGSKIFEWDGCVYEDCDIFNNIGNGQWSDHDSANVTNLGCRFYGNTRRDIFWEKCGRRTNPYDPTPPFNEVYHGPLTVDGCEFSEPNPLTSPQREAGYEVIGCVAACFGVFKNLNFHDGRQLAIWIRNDPNRMEPLASQKPTEPGWYVEGYEVWNSLNTYNGEQVKVSGNPTPPTGAVVYK